jgi:hypothetical protein
MDNNKHGPNAYGPFFHPSIFLNFFFLFDNWTLRTGLVGLHNPLICLCPILRVSRSFVTMLSFIILALCYRNLLMDTRTFYFMDLDTDTDMHGLREK